MLRMRLSKAHHEGLPHSPGKPGTQPASHLPQQGLILMVSYLQHQSSPMRTLAKPPKAKQTTPSNEAQKKENKQQPSKKLTKTVFHSPFRYKIQTLNLEDAETVVNMLIDYAVNLRRQFGSEVKSVKNEKFISFSPKVKLTKPTLSVPHLIYGVKQCTATLKRKQSPIMLVIIFYDQSKHDNIEELLCSIVYHKIPYLLVRQSQKLKDQLGVKQLLAMGLTVEEVANNFLAYCSKCMIEIPWLVDAKWIPLQK